MDAVEYVTQRNRMCDYYVSCSECPVGQYKVCASIVGIPKLIPIIEQWAKEHPVKTRQSEFLKIFPNAKKSPNGVIDICPKQFDPEKYIAKEFEDRCIYFFTTTEHPCDKCRRDFWLKEIE